MLVVCQADGVGPHLPDQLHVGVMVLLCDGVADPLPVLVAADAVEGIAPSIEEKPLAGIHVKVPDTEAGTHPVYLLAVHGKGGHGGVEIG